MKHLSDAEKWKLLSREDLNQAASVLGAESEEKAADIAEELGLAYMAEVISKLGSDSAAELLRNLPEDFRAQILRSISSERRASLQEILSYPAGSAGALMSKEFLAVPEEYTLAETLRYLQSISAERRGKVSYIYVVDKNRRLLGVIQIRDLVFYPHEKFVRDVMRSPIVQVETEMSQMDVSKLLARHRYLGLPVVDTAQKLVGVVSADSVLQAIEEETTDDIAKIVGTSAEELKTRSVFKIFRLRLPWLLVSIASGLVCAYISGVFQNNFQTIAALFLFVPVVLGLSESTGVQGATMVMRNLATGHVDLKDMWPLFFRELSVGILIGMVCGSIVGLTAFVWQGSEPLGRALAISMTSAICISALIGLSLPLIFRKMKMDPAIASGPIVLAICDLQTLLVYFGLSSRILS